MFKFSDFNIADEQQGFAGEKIKIERILNREIVVHAYKIAKSDYTETRLDMQITVDNAKRVVWSGSKSLQQDIQKVPKDKFPFTTTIIKVDDGRYKFT